MTLKICSLNWMNSVLATPFVSLEIPFEKSKVCVNLGHTVPESAAWTFDHQADDVLRCVGQR